MPHGTATVETRITYRHPALPDENTPWVMREIPEEAYLPHDAVTELIETIVSQTVTEFSHEGRIDRDYFENPVRLSDFCDFMYNTLLVELKQHLEEHTSDETPYVLNGKYEFTKDVLHEAFPDATTQDRRGDIHSKQKLVEMTLAITEYVLDIAKHGVDADSYESKRTQTFSDGLDYVNKLAVKK